jgi:3-oxoadipate enol-lactonase
MIDRGQGEAIVLIPGIQGRWEWMAPAVQALAARGRVLTGSLCGDAGSGCEYDPALGLENYVGQIESWLDCAGVQTAAVCGVSYGGLIAVRFAAAKPGRLTALVLASTPSPTWRPDARAGRYARWPRLAAPAFALRAPFNMRPEVFAAFPDLGGRVRFFVRQGWRAIRAPMSPSRMAERIRVAIAHDFVADCRQIGVPTLVLTGEPQLDRIVPTRGTREYLEVIAGAEARVLERTGHIGLVTRPDAFADAVWGFVTTERSLGSE